MKNLNSELSELERLIARLDAHVFLPRAADMIERVATIYFLAPSSFLGHAFVATVAARLQEKGKKIVLVDDTLLKAPQGVECEIQTTRQYRSQDATSALAINFANTPFVHAFFDELSAANGMLKVDIIEVLDAMQIPVIYQCAAQMREATRSRLGDYLALAHKFDDALSIRTLGAILELRMTLNRQQLLPILCSLEDEYFSVYPSGKDVSFSLGHDEVFCDVGAHVGSTIRKLLAATHWRYTHIHAFEPDAGNYASLTAGLFSTMSNFTPRNIALSDVAGIVGFAETGTMGSRLDAHGNVKVHASTLDAEVPHATFIKMDVEGHETRILRGARRLITESKPRLAITGYHYADDLLDIAALVHEYEPAYRFRLRHHSFYYYDTILYANIKT